MIIQKFKCPHCGNTDNRKTKYYDGLLGYEAVICLKCGWYGDHFGLHPKDDWSEQYLPNSKVISPIFKKK